jgi:hypothetical protein
MLGQVFKQGLTGFESRWLHHLLPRSMCDNGQNARYPGLTVASTSRSGTTFDGPFETFFVQRGHAIYGDLGESPLGDRARDHDEIAAVPAAVRPEVAGAGDQHQPGRSADVEDLLVVDQVGARHLA